MYSTNIKLKLENKDVQNKLGSTFLSRRPQIYAQPADPVYSDTLHFSSRRLTPLYTAKSALTTADQAGSDDKNWPAAEASIMVEPSLDR